jgi:hypothetical protein
VRMRPLLLLAACGGLAWVALESEAPHAALPVPARPAAFEPRQVALAALPALPAPPAGPWPEQVERPLFEPGRRPATTPAAVQAPPPPPPPPPVAAIGVVLRTAGAVALLRLADERIVRAAEGEEVEGWLVARIGAEGVELRREGKSLHLPVRARAAEGILQH